jgi:UPF0271 protein
MIDINCDMGEIEELLMDNTYSNLMDHVTSINIACGGHAGDKEMMQKIVQIAKKKKVKIGAHPSYPDRKNFGRYELKIDPQELSDSIAKQINDLIVIADSENITIDHIKPHGALYNKAAKNKELATLICDTVKKINPDLSIMCLAESPMVSVIEKLGMKAISEAFADRAYEKDGSLRKRNLDGALITDDISAAKQAKQLYFNNKVVAYDGSEVSINSETICVHSDTPNALNIVKAVRQRLRKNN